MNNITTTVLGLFTALALTISVEAAAGWLLGLRSRHNQLVLLLINCITNPLLTVAAALAGYYHLSTIHTPFDPALLAMEALVVSTEALLLRLTLKLPIARSILVSLLINAASWLAGAVLLWG